MDENYSTSYEHAVTENNLSDDVTRSGIYLCDLCDKIYKSKQGLSYHIKAHTGEKPHKCAECGKSFIELFQLKVHSIMHKGERPHKRTESGKSFAQKKVLTIHMRTHTGEKPHQCMRKKVYNFYKP